MMEDEAMFGVTKRNLNEKKSIEEVQLKFTSRNQKYSFILTASL